MKLSSATAAGGTRTSFLRSKSCAEIVTGISPRFAAAAYAVIDPSGYRPEQVRAVIGVLGSAIAHYTFISSISVYRDFPPHRSFDEDAPLAQGDQGYGALKARCEDVLEETLPGQIARVRPGLIVGPHDPTDRFTYWPRRVARGGNVLAPGRPERAVQLVDVRDLAEWCVRLAEQY